MIRSTLKATQNATFSIDLPNAGAKGMPTPMGTGFFVSPDGWFVTAAHVVTVDNNPNSQVRDDIGSGWLQKKVRPGEFGSAMCQGITVEFLDPDTDFALLKVDFDSNKNKSWLERLEGFPSIEVSDRELEDGEPVYSFGYPLAESGVVHENGGVTIGHVAHRPRVTSAIIASTVYESVMVWTSKLPMKYVLDKALNYGNSGGPILATATGKVHALCSSFQPVGIPQPFLKDEDGNSLPIFIPSLYGIVSSLNNEAIQSAFRERGISICSD